jgi:hypothetical protein
LRIYNRGTMSQDGMSQRMIKREKMKTQNGEQMYSKKHVRMMEALREKNETKPKQFKDNSVRD